MNRRLLTGAMFFLPAAAFAQGHAHGERGPNGGSMQDIIGIHAELVIADRTLTIHLYDERMQPQPATGFSGSLLVGAGQTRQVVQLASGSGNTLTGTSQTAPPRGTAMTLQLRNPANRSGQARF
jgi:hypothetical protein